MCRGEAPQKFIYKKWRFYFPTPSFVQIKRLFHWGYMNLLSKLVNLHVIFLTWHNTLIQVSGKKDSFWRQRRFEIWNLVKDMHLSLSAFQVYHILCKVWSWILEPLSWTLWVRGPCTTPFSAVAFTLGQKTNPLDPILEMLQEIYTL